jgi:hypothetical protein
MVVEPHRNNKRNINNMQKSKLSLGLMLLAIVMVAGNSFGTPSPLPPTTAPDAGSSALLMSIGFAGLAAVRKFMR